MIFHDKNILTRNGKPGYVFNIVGISAARFDSRNTKGA